MSEQRPNTHTKDEKKEKKDNCIGIEGPPVIRGVLLNVIWETVYQCIFNENIKPSLTFEEVHIIQNRLNEYVEAVKFKARMDFDEQPSKTPINDNSYVK